MGQLERYGLYVLCLVIFLILGVAIWGENPQAAHLARMQSDRLANAGNANPGGNVPPGRNAPRTKSGALTPSRLLQLADGPPSAPPGDVGQPRRTTEDSVRPAPVNRKPVNASAAKSVTYTVKPGEVLGTILERHYGRSRVYQQMVVDANPGLDPNKLSRGQEIVLPPIPSATSSLLVKSGNPPAGKSSAPAGTREYTIKSGDNPSTIAKKVLKDKNRYLEIVKLNPNMNAKALQKGDVILIPADR